MYTTHEEAAQAHTTLFAKILSDAESLSEQIDVLVQKRKDMCDADDFCYEDETYQQLRINIHILQIEAVSAYQEAQLHLMAANRHTEMAKWEVDREDPSYCW